MNADWLEKRIERLPWSGCWIWLGAVQRKGYGWTGDPTIGRSDLAHRAAWRAMVGEIPAGMHVLHRCDVRACVNPSHLFLGTNADNVLDREFKGRGVRLTGELHGRATLRDDDVRVMRSRFEAGEQIAVIARDFHVGWSTAKDAIQRKTWRHL